MAKQAKRRRARAAEEPRAERMNAGREPDRRQDLAMIVWLLAPERIETLRRRLIDGAAGAIEPFLYTLAYDGPLDSGPPVIWVASEPLAAEAGHTPADPPKAEGRETNPAGGGKTESESGNGIRWDKRAMEVRRAARALVEDPEYQESLRRRLDDGKAPQMMRLLLQWPAMKSHDPRELRRGKPPLVVGSMKYLPWDPRADPLRERAQRMIEAKARQEEEARARPAAPDKQAAATPEDPEEAEQLVCVYRPEFDEPPAPPYRSR
jgi:hypothetical protein